LLPLPDFGLKIWEGPTLLVAFFLPQKAAGRVGQNSSVALAKEGYHLKEIDN